MTPSLVFSIVPLLVAASLGCTSTARDAHADTPRDTGRDTALVAVHGELLADGSCRATVTGVPLFAARDTPRTTLDAGATADLAPAGYVLHQIECAVADDPAHGRERADAPSVLVTLYARANAPIRAGRYLVRAGLADASDTLGAATRAGVAIFGAPSATGSSVSGGVRYLEGRRGALEITSIEGAHVVGRFDVRAGAAWSM